MTRTAKRVFTAPGDIEHLQAQIGELCEGAYVRLTTKDGDIQQGTVSARPQAQLFFDPDGAEGTNAVVRLVEPAMDPVGASQREFWLDEIARIERLDPP
ncbi:DUF3247 family protein [Lysobacter sp. GX 14042]|uniref:DUF3247 family protein n=1 Tax=Lysobacter sp. GX 14042 TaxID=2907155 RepID=UPI001F38955D|nr:DUF3247 family protein [Lysobacter sp. GX 14042]MCE7033044.1 DUF3247 family protein [Lysobacter sp. GX 14042]